MENECFALSDENHLEQLRINGNQRVKMNCLTNASFGTGLNIM